MGTMIRQSAPVWEQPSILAASASAEGTLEKKAVRKYTVYGTFRVVYKIINVIRCPTSPARTNQQ